MNDEERLIYISGTSEQVSDAFDLFSEILYASYTQTPGNDPFSVHTLIDHKKAGRVVGTKVGRILLIR